MSPTVVNGVQESRGGTNAVVAAGADHELTIEARGLKKTYGKVAAVEELDLTARAGEVVGLLGPNGAGKTTSIRVLTTILPPTAGSFSIAGIPHTRAAEVRRRIGVLPESAGYPDQQTGVEFLRYYARLFGQSRASANGAAAALLDEVGLAERGSSRIATYSRGMRQRLGIARALINEPAVVFLDEPTLGLDPAGQRQVLRVVEDIARERGATVLLSTHFLAEVEETCSRVLILNHGRVIAEGTVDEIARKAAAPRRARFRVPAEMHERALQLLAAAHGVKSARQLDGRPDWLAVTLDETAGGTAPAQVAIDHALAALTQGGVRLLAFELEGARLSDAFLAMTAED
jgi:ABC-2 type transport system ATP-binding protein